MMKKSVLVVSLLLTLLLMSTPSIYAGSEHTTKQADTLNKLGLFSGTGQSYQLEASVTRAQGTAMLLRLSGEEKEAAKANLKPTFTDVKSSHWAAASIAFSVRKGYVRGVSTTTFAPEKRMTGKEFLTLVNRLLGYPDAVPNNSLELTQKNGLLQADAAKRLAAANPFLRGDMVEVAYAALLTQPSGSKSTLLQKLVEDKGLIPVATAVSTGLYTPPSTEPKATSGGYIPKPGADPMDAIEEAIRQKLNEK